MTSQSTKKYLGISRRKVARLAVEIKKDKVVLAKAKLLALPQKAARELYKTLHSAEANFLVKNQNFNTDDLIVKNILVDVGPTAKRFRPRARGSADRIKKKSCHIKVILSDS